ncbi:unnamed protein product [Staphylococcus haemolyticus JCSC1435]|uniref:Uncharacterized protein n=1 Tax=Staphylococcus haemolyticus (strain JCSC1435) TaxID=279808 RepID=Q4L729_STAHJ|nr:unnamed protein product [Staphylococcus haemolyticus JCSC1435]
MLTKYCRLKNFLKLMENAFKFKLLCYTIFIKYNI